MGKSLNGKHLGKGISQRKDGWYIGRYTDRFGKRQTLYARTLKEISKKLNDAKYEDAHLLNLADPNQTLDEWFDIWISKCKKHCRSTTIRTYKTQYRMIKDLLGHKQISSLKPIVLQDAFNELRTDAMREKCKALLVDILNKAVESDMLQKNPAKNIVTKIDNNMKEEKRILSEDEIELLYSVCNKSGYMYKMFVIALNTGMRIGEILGLCWDCVDFDENIIHIRRTLTYLPNNGNAIYEFHNPKTINGIRDIPMSKDVKKVLLEQWMYWQTVNSRHTPQFGFDNLVFISKTYHPINEANVRSTIKYYVDLINQEHPESKFKIFTMHCLRHTYATNAIAAGMKPKVLQKILGHATLQMTMDLYTHVRQESIKDGMSLLAEMA